MKNNPHINILVQLAKVDGETDEAELELIRQIGASNHISDTDIEEIIKNAQAADTVPAIENWSKAEKAGLMKDLVMVMKIDGIVHKEEMKFCMKIIKKLGYPEDALFDLVSSTYVDKATAENPELIKQRAEQYLK